MAYRQGRALRGPPPPPAGAIRPDVSPPISEERTTTARHEEPGAVVRRRGRVGLRPRTDRLARKAAREQRPPRGAEGLGDPANGSGTGCLTRRGRGYAERTPRGQAEMIV